MSLLSKWTLLVLAFMSLNACTLFSPVKNENATVYLINNAPKNLAHKKKSHLNLLVTIPETDAVYNTLQIAYSNRPYEIDYFIKSRWAETPSQMLLPLLTETLSATHYYHAVSSVSTLAHYDYALNTHISSMLVDFSHRPAKFRLTVRVEFIRVSDAAIVATKTIQINEPLVCDNPYSAVLAANRAANRMLREVAAFCLKHSSRG